MRACNLNPTLATIDEVGGMKEKGKKIMVIDDFYPIFAKVKLAKGTGGIHDFVEILKLYDKNEDGTILGNELFRLLTNLGKFVKYRQFLTDRSTFIAWEPKSTAEGAKWFFA